MPLRNNQAAFGALLSSSSCFGVLHLMMRRGYTKYSRQLASLEQCTPGKGNNFVTTAAPSK